MLNTGHQPILIKSITCPKRALSIKFPKAPARTKAVEKKGIGIFGRSSK